MIARSEQCGRSLELLEELVALTLIPSVFEVNGHQVLYSLCCMIIFDRRVVLSACSSVSFVVKRECLNVSVCFGLLLLHMLL